ncbi:MAG: hypothetical protein AAF449_08645 [Myxococcota bacterium]
MIFHELDKVTPQKERARFDPWQAALTGRLQPSGATITFLGNRVLKSAEGKSATRLQQQADWLLSASAAGNRNLPKVLDFFRQEERGTLIRFAYIMPRYGTPPEDPLVVASQAHAALRPLWSGSYRQTLSFDPVGYAERLAALVCPFDAHAGEELLALASCLNWEGRTKAATVHGDPTYENLAWDPDNGIILLDPNIQSSPSVLCPELDIAKLMLSLGGWEDFVSGKSQYISPGRMITTALDRFSANYCVASIYWLAAGHLIRTLPYGAKRCAPESVLPSIRQWLSASRAHL